MKDSDVNLPTVLVIRLPECLYLINNILFDSINYSNGDFCTTNEKRAINFKATSTSSRLISIAAFEISKRLIMVERRIYRKSML